jgi:hypothetical protein
MKTKRLRKIMLVLATSAAGILTLPLGVLSDEDRPSPEVITLTEAEILVYLLPQAQELRKQGMDVGWESQTGPKFNHDDFYTFWVVNAKRPHVEGSVTVGFFDVNKHTGEVWDEGLERFVTSTELDGVQAIVRKAHGIDSSTLAKYHSAKP